MRRGESSWVRRRLRGERAGAAEGEADDAEGEEEERGGFGGCGEAGVIEVPIAGTGADGGADADADGLTSEGVGGLDFGDHDGEVEEVERVSGGKIGEMINDLVGGADGDGIISGVTVVEAELEGIALGEIFSEDAESELVRFTGLESGIKIVGGGGVIPVLGGEVLEEAVAGKGEEIGGLGALGVLVVGRWVEEDAGSLHPVEAGGFIEVGGFGVFLPRIDEDIDAEGLSNAGLRFEGEVRNGEVGGVERVEGEESGGNCEKLRNFHRDNHNEGSRYDKVSIFPRETQIARLFGFLWWGRVGGGGGKAKVVRVESVA